MLVIAFLLLVVAPEVERRDISILQEKRPCPESAVTTWNVVSMSACAVPAITARTTVTNEKYFIA